MSKGFKHGAGGVSALNFKIVGGAIQPGNPKENTLWVNTETDISGWVFSPEEPENPIEGLVWIGLGTASPAPFNALKKGGLYCFPTSCVQYVGGAWANKDAFLFTGGDWIAFSSEIFWIYDNGVTSLTWSGTGTDTSSALVMTTSHGSFGGSYQSAGWKGSTGKITVPSSATKLCMKYSVSVRTGSFSSFKNKAFGLRSSALSAYEGNQSGFTAYVDLTSGSNVTVSVPITSSMKGNSYYIGFHANTGANNTQVVSTWTVSQIWFE